MDPNLYQESDLFIKGMTALVAAIAASIGLWKYFDTSKKEFRKPYWERQLSLYFEVTAAAGTLAAISSGKIATSDRKDLQTKTLEKFWELYYGPLEIVTDNEVTDAIMQFKECLLGHQNGRRNGRDMELCALSLARACRKSIGDSWDVELSKLHKRTD